MLHPVQFYRDIVGTSDPSLIAKFGTAAWWGGQGNTLPATVRHCCVVCRVILPSGRGNTTRSTVCLLYAVLHSLCTLRSVLLMLHVARTITMRSRTGVDDWHDSLRQPE
jgi:hypothetical protein